VCVWVCVCVCVCVCVYRPPLLSLEALHFASSYSASFPTQLSLLSVCNSWCLSETLKASVCSVHSSFLRGISTPRITSYPIYTSRTQSRNTVLRLWSFKMFFWMTVAVDESSSSSPPPQATSWRMCTPGYWSLYLIHWRPWLLFLWVFTLKPFWGLFIFTHSLYWFY
jgi:hypothetical protein